MRSAIALSALAAFVVTLSHGVETAAQQIGVVKFIKYRAQQKREPSLAWKSLWVTDPIYFKQTVRTPDQAALHILFKDGSRLNLGRNSSMQIDEFVYDPKTSTGKLTATVTKGFFRFVSGKIAKKDFKLKIPGATIGIRGTALNGNVNRPKTAIRPDVLHWIEILTGKIIVITKKTAKEFAKGTIIGILRDGSIITLEAALDVDYFSNQGPEQDANKNMNGEGKGPGYSGNSGNSGDSNGPSTGTSTSPSGSGGTTSP